jgi:GWxTD domain-containing protein
MAHVVYGGVVTRRFLVVVLVVAFGTGCGSQWKRVGTDQPGPTAEESLTDAFNPQNSYRGMGRLTAPEPLPFIGHVVFADGPADSVIAVVGLSLENRSLTFQREGDNFVARYRVEMRLQQEGDPPIRLAREEAVRVPTFQETLRNDESVLFQQSFHLTPGKYTIALAVSDRASPAQSRAQADYLVPDFAPGSTSEPMIVYQVTGRDSPRQPLSILLNPRGAVSYGGDTLLAYIEGYGFPEPTKVPFEVRDEFDKVVYSDSLLFQGVHPVESHIVRLAPDSQPLGEITLAVGSDVNQRTTTALVSFSQGWVLTNYDEMLGLLRYFGRDEWVDSLRRTPVAQRSNVWREFWEATDPNRATPENEALDVYFARVQSANTLFRNEGVPGWRTDRGEVYITIGQPDEVFDNRTDAEGRYIVWSYTELRVDLFFEDLARFGHYRLTPQSRADYSRVLVRVQRQGAG